MQFDSSRMQGLSGISVSSQLGMVRLFTSCFVVLICHLLLQDFSQCVKKYVMKLGQNSVTTKQLNSLLFNSLFYSQLQWENSLYCASFNLISQHWATGGNSEGRKLHSWPQHFCSFVASSRNLARVFSCSVVICQRWADLKWGGHVVLYRTVDVHVFSHACTL